MSIDTWSQYFDVFDQTAYSVYVWTDWSSTVNFNQIWFTTNPADPSNVDYSTMPNVQGAPAATENVTPLSALPVPYVAPQMGVPAPWYEREVNYAIGRSGFNGAEIQSEYFVSYSNGPAAVKALIPLASEINAIVYTCLIRVIAPDGMWLSMASGPDVGGARSIAIHFTWQLNLSAVMALLPKIEQALAPYNPKPHWGKLFTMDPCSYLPLYSKLNDWKKLRKQLDPKGKWINFFLHNNVLANCTGSG